VIVAAGASGLGGGLEAEHLALQPVRERVPAQADAAQPLHRGARRQVVVVHVGGDARPAEADEGVLQRRPPGPGRARRAAATR